MLDCLIWVGRAFQKKDVSAKALCPHVWYLVLGVARTCASTDLRHLDELEWKRRSEKQGGARLLRAS